MFLSFPATTTEVATPSKSGGSKVVFPTRPGGGARKSASRTTPKSVMNDEPRKPVPAIHKGWPTRLVFTGKIEVNPVRKL